MPDRRFLFLTASARPNGNSELLARAAAALPRQTVQVWHGLTATPLPAFHDLRHDAGYGPPQDHAATLPTATMAASNIVIAAPLLLVQPARTRQTLS
jgi:hypothetical protein